MTPETAGVRIAMSQAISLKRIADSLDDMAALKLNPLLPTGEAKTAYDAYAAPLNMPADVLDKPGTVMTVRLAERTAVINALCRAPDERHVWGGFGSLPRRIQETLVDTAIAALRAFDEQQAKRTAEPRKPVDPRDWLLPDDQEALLVNRNDTLIEVRYTDATRRNAVVPPPTKLYLGEAIDWSTWETGPRRLKSSIEVWRVVR